MILDTNALSAWAEGRESIRRPLESAIQLVIPSIVIGEYYFGIRQSRKRKRYETWLQQFLPLTAIASVTHATAKIYADVRQELKRAGHPIPSNDAWIAALVRQHNLPLLSNDLHFDHVSGIERIDF